VAHPPHDLRERFWRFVSKTPGCWFWTGSLDRDGYGLLVIVDHTRSSGRQWLKAHRLSWEFATGDKPLLGVLHRCDVRSCVRPDHLFEGDDAANNRDMTLKGRNIFQHKNPSKKLTVAEVFGLKLGRLMGTPLKALAERYNVRESTVSRIANGVRRAGHQWLNL
jgi:hypothetical protein